MRAHLVKTDKEMLDEVKAINVEIYFYHEKGFYVFYVL